VADQRVWAVLSDRAQGQFPLSIPTSLAIESACGILPEAPTEAPEVKRRTLLMVNVRTLVRNLIGSIETDNRRWLEPYSMAEVIANEMRTIEQVIAEHSDGRCAVLFYQCTYSDLLREFSRAIIKTPNTPSQQWHQDTERNTLKALTKETAQGASVTTYTRNFPDLGGDAMIITHYPLDLLQRYRFQSLVLLESHTGAIKPPVMWNTKLYNGRELELLPFDRMTLQMFGDGVLFTPMPIKIRKRVYGIAVKTQWTPITTEAYVISCVENNHDPALTVLVKDLYRK